MSSIDSANNVHCANLVLSDFSIPIYWVHSELSHDRTGLPVTNKDLMIGGGSGEHPALHVKNADLLGLWLIAKDYWFDGEELQKISDFYLKKLKERARDDYEAEIFDSYPYNFENFIDIADWPISSLAQLDLIYNKKIGVDAKDLAHKSTEAALQVSIAVNIVFNMPQDFFDADVYKMMQDNKDKYQKYKYTSVFNISEVKKENAMGKWIKDGKVVWGYSLENYINDKNKSLTSEYVKKIKP